MTITDLTFIFLFLPLSLIIYNISKECIKKYCLLVSSLIFYACGSLKYFVLLLISLSINILIAWLISEIREKSILKTGLLVWGIIYNVSILIYYKYADFVLDAIGKWKDSEVISMNSVLPLGLSFFVFKSISYLIDTYLNKISVEKNPINAVLYLSFFAQIQSGPLSRYQDMWLISDVYKISRSKFDDFSEGVYRFIIGFNKKVLISNVLSNITIETFATSSGHMSMAYAWLGSICYSLQLFFDFSGYSDMAIGLSRMFGFKCPENFYYPYMTKSVSEFWRRWHITLGAWFRDYIYIPLGGSRGKKWRICVNLFIVWILTGIWHGASWNFLFWGVYYFGLITFEKMTGWPQKFKSKALKIMYRVLTLLFINFGWVIFRTSELQDGISYIRSMLWYSSDTLANTRALFLFKDNFVFILAAVILCFPIVPWLEKKMNQRNISCNLWNLLIIIVNGALFIWALSFVISGQNNPFAYANF